MRVVQLSDHPGALLQQAQRQRSSADREARLAYENALAIHRQQVAGARQVRDQARAGRRWGAWLRGVFAVRREQRRAPAAPLLVTAPTGQEESLAAGIEGERLAGAWLERVLDDQWTLLRGYCNRRGEIDHVLVGPRGVFAIEVKHRNASVYCAGDQWRYIKYDNYRNPVERGELTDRKGRSPSRQLNEPAGQLQDFLCSRGQPVAIERIVVLTHPRAQVAGCTSPTVHIATSAGQLIRLLNDSPHTLTPADRAKLEQLIVRDHGHHQARRPH